MLRTSRVPAMRTGSWMAERCLGCCQIWVPDLGTLGGCACCGVERGPSTVLIWWKSWFSSISPDDTTNWLVVFETCSDHQREGTDVNSWVWFIKRFDVLFPIRKPTGVEEFGGSNSWIPHKFPKSSSPDAGTCSCSPAKGRQDTKQWDCRPLDLNRKPQEWFGKMHFLLKHGDFWVPHWILGVYQLRPTFRVQYICRSFNYPWRHSGGKTSIFQWSELHAGLWGATRYRFSGPTRNSDQTTVKKSGEFLESQNLEQ